MKLHVVKELNGMTGRTAFCRSNTVQLSTLIANPGHIGTSQFSLHCERVCLYPFLVFSHSLTQTSQCSSAPKEQLHQSVHLLEFGLHKLGCHSLESLTRPASCHEVGDETQAALLELTTHITLTCRVQVHTAINLQDARQPSLSLTVYTTMFARS